MRRWVGAWLALLVLVIVGVVQSGRVVASALPADAYSVSYDPPLVSGAGLQVVADKAMDAQGRAVYSVSLINQAAHTANFVLPLGAAVSVVDGTVYRLDARVELTGGVRPMQVGIGYQLLRADGGYVADWAPASGQYALAAGATQSVSAAYLGGDANALKGVAVAKALPRLVVFNIPAGRTVSLSMKALTQEQRVVAGKVELAAWSSMPQSVAPGSVLPLDVQLRMAPGGQVYSSMLSLQSGAKVYRQTQQVEAASGRWSAVQDGWNWPVPSDAPEGAYAVVYEVPALGIKQTLGTVSVAPVGAGMAIGFGVHRYPGSSETTLGPMQGTHQFVRSLAHDKLYLTQWWLGPDHYDWTALDEWADFHAKDGRRRLLLTFSGSPRWASASPDQPSAMGAMGNAAPPKPMFRDAYARMVSQTVARLKGRLLAVECWNEPDVPSFFSGTQTDLADLCAAVSVQAKAQDAEVKVICPQPTDPVALDWVYSSKTRSGVPIHQFCDWVGSHVYNRLGQDPKGYDYVRDAGVDQVMDSIRLINQRHGMDKPIAVTEFGVSSCEVRPAEWHPTAFGAMPSAQAAEALYQSIRAFRQKGAVALGLYSYDHGPTDPSCVPGGSFVRATMIGSDSKQRLDSVVLGRVTQAVRDFGQDD